MGPTIFTQQLAELSHFSLAFSSEKTTSSYKRAGSVNVGRSDHNAINTVNSGDVLALL